MITDDEFAAHLSQDQNPREVLIELDYVVESAGAPLVQTLRFSHFGYIDDVNKNVYEDALRALGQYQRSLSGDRLGQYNSSIGSFELDNNEGRVDFILGLAIDGSEVRVYVGAPQWEFADFRLFFTALAVRATAPDHATLRIDLRDSSLSLEKSIGGDVLVAGSGPNRDRYAPLNFGFIHNLEAIPKDSAFLIYQHSDTGVNTQVEDVRDRGVSVIFTDNNDGTFTLSASPDGMVTCDVLAYSNVGSPSLSTDRKVSDAMDVLIGQRAGFSAAGLYAGAGPTFTRGDADDYLVGKSIPQAENVVTILGTLVDSGNAFWAIRRDNKFTFGRLRPHDIESLGLTPIDIENDDIDWDATFAIDHLPTQYYLLQAFMHRNWVQQTDLASSLTPGERFVWSRDGLHLLQVGPGGTTYNDAPELYDKTLQLSPIIDTLLSGEFDELDLPFLSQWMEVRRAMWLPWIEVVSIVVGIDFYYLELGDVVRLTVDRYGYDAGVLFQVCAIDIRISDAKVALRLVRRRLLADPPEPWTIPPDVIEAPRLPFRPKSFVTPIETPADTGRPPGFPFPGGGGGGGGDSSMGVVITSLFTKAGAGYAHFGVDDPHFFDSSSVTP